MTIPPDQQLDARRGLPEDLLYLARRHPRPWDGAPGLAGTGEIWLGNHRYFRAVTDWLAGFVDGLRVADVPPDAFPAPFRSRVGALLSGLDGHHRIEDQYYFPRFMQAEPRLLHGFEIMEDDHHVIHRAIFELSSAGRALVEALGAPSERLSPDAARAADAAAGTFGGFRTALARHLDDEEDLVIPLLLERAAADPDLG